MDLNQLLSLALSMLSGLIGGIGGSWLAFRIRFERFEAMDHEREQNRREWRKVVDRRLDAHAERIAKVSDHETRLKQIEMEVQKLRDRWHDLRDNTLKELYDLFRKWRDDMISTFVRRKE